MQDINFLIDLWSRIKPLIPAKDRLDAADAIMDIFDSYGMTDEIESDSHALDPLLRAAVKSRYGLDSNEEEENDHEDQY